MRRRRRSLLAKARRAGIRIGYPCRGEGICGKCAVEILEGSTLLQPAGDEERALLEREAAGPSERMSCLAEIRGEGVVTLRVGGGTYRVALSAR